MKKIYSFLAIATTLFMCSACNNEWEDELYTQMVSLKAPYETRESPISICATSRMAR